MTSSLTGCLTHSKPPIITYLHTKVSSGLSYISHLWSSNGHGIILQNLHSFYKHCSVLQWICIIPSKDHKFGITIEGCQILDCIWRHKPQCILEPWMGELDIMKPISDKFSEKKTHFLRLPWLYMPDLPLTLIQIRGLHPGGYVTHMHDKCQIFKMHI